MSERRFSNCVGVNLTASFAAPFSFSGSEWPAITPNSQSNLLSISLNMSCKCGTWCPILPTCHSSLERWKPRAHTYCPLEHGFHRHELISFGSLLHKTNFIFICLQFSSLHGGHPRYSACCYIHSPHLWHLRQACNPNYKAQKCYTNHGLSYNRP